MLVYRVTGYTVFVAEQPDYARLGELLPTLALSVCANQNTVA
jgi:hypothetical protein